MSFGPGELGTGMCPRDGALGRIRLRGFVIHEARPVVIHLISLEWATERVCMPSKLACCLSDLCLAAMTLRSKFLLCCVDMSRRSDKLRSKWCLSARDRAWAPASNSAVTLTKIISCEFVLLFCPLCLMSFVPILTLLTFELIVFHHDQISRSKSIKTHKIQAGVLHLPLISTTRPTTLWKSSANH